MPDISVTYPLDMSGNSPANLVTGELHTVTEAHYRDYYFLVPNFAPFYVDNFKATITVGNETRDLIEDVDFSFAISYVTGTRTTGKAMYGGITLHNLNLNGIITIDYQTIGGDQIADRLHVLTVLADKAWNPRQCIWDILTNVPNAFPPLPGYADYDSFYGQEEVVTALGEIRDAILNNSSLTQEKIAEFLQIINSGVLSTYIRKTGDTMTGRLLLQGNPVEENEAATKKYVDENTVDMAELSSFMSSYHNATYVNDRLDEKINKVGDTMTGHLTLNSDPVQDLHASTKKYVDRAENNLQLQINDISTNLGNIQSGYVTKEYVDDKINEVMAYVSNVVLNK